MTAPTGLPKHEPILENMAEIPGGDTRDVPGGEGDTGGVPPGGAVATSQARESEPNSAAVDRLVSAEAQARALTLGSFREAMRTRAASPLVLARLDALLEGKADPVTGKVAHLKPETWDAIRQDVTNRGYGRPHQSLDVTSGGEALTPGVVFLPVPVPLPGPDSPEAFELDEGADLNPLQLVAGDASKVEAGRAVARLIEAGRDDGTLPR